MLGFRLSSDPKSLDIIRYKGAFEVNEQPFNYIGMLQWHDHMPKVVLSSNFSYLTANEVKQLSWRLNLILARQVEFRDNLLEQLLDETK